MHSENVKKIERDRGANMVEYALLVALIGIIALVALREMGTRVKCVMAKPGWYIQTDGRGGGYAGPDELYHGCRLFEIP